MDDLSNSQDACFLGLIFGMAETEGQPENIMSLQNGLRQLGIDDPIEAPIAKNLFEPIQDRLRIIGQPSRDWFLVGFFTVLCLKVSSFREPLDETFAKLEHYLIEQKLPLSDRKEIYELFCSYGSKGSANVDVKEVFDVLLDKAMNSNNENSRRAGIVVENNHGVVSGEGSKFESVTFDQRSVSFEGDFSKIADQLSLLKNTMVPLATGAVHFKQLAAVAEAEEAAKSSDGTKLSEALKNTGSWTLETARKIGVPVAVQAIKDSLGLT